MTERGIVILDERSRLGRRRVLRAGSALAGAALLKTPFAVVPGRGGSSGS